MGIVIVDRIMGSRKTTDEIERIKARTPKERLETPLLIVVPLTSEVERYIRDCEGENLVEPTCYYSTYDSKYFSKSESLLGLLTRGHSIVTTLPY